MNNVIFDLIQKKINSAFNSFVRAENVDVVRDDWDQGQKKKMTSVVEENAEQPKKYKRLRKISRQDSQNELINSDDDNNDGFNAFASKFVVLDQVCCC